MGAGSQEKHHIQDAAEVYAVYRLQQLAVINGCAINDDVEEKHKEFLDYCEERNLSVDTFNASKYRKSIDNHIVSIFDDLRKKYPEEKFNFICCEVENRNLGKKGDFMIEFLKLPSKSVSLKNYEKRYSSIQTCSGTWISCPNNFLFDSVGAGGMFYHPNHPKDKKYKFKGDNKSGTRNKILEEMGYGFLIPELYDYFEEVLEKIKKKYVYSSDALWWNDIKDQWKKDCEDYGNEAIKRVMSALKKLPQSMIKERILKQTGLDGAEELLLLSPKKYRCSLFDEEYSDAIKRANSEESWVDFIKHKKNVRFILRDKKGYIAHMDMPFTLQKNGCWAYVEDYPDGFPDDLVLDENGKLPYNGGKKSVDKGTSFGWGERRPMKSKQMNTSTNTHLKLDTIGKVDAI